MINISLIGMDIYLAGRFSKEIHEKVAKIYGVSEDEVFVSAFDSFVYHKGNEQTSFNLLIKVESERKFQNIEKEVAELILDCSKNYSIHTTCYFVYFDAHTSVYNRVNSEYNRFLDGQDEEDDYTEEEYEKMDNYSETGEEIYHGNVFEDFDKDNPDEAIGSFEEEISADDTGYNIFEGFSKH